MADFYPHPKNLSEDKFKNNGLISLMEEISQEPNTDSVTWLLLITLIMVSNDKGQGGRNTRVQSEEEKGMWKPNGTAKTLLEERLELLMKLVPLRD